MGAFESRIKDISELPNLSEMDRDSDGLPRNWCFCKGHNGLHHDQWAVQFVHEDLSADVYPLPLFVSVLIRWERNNERETMQRALQALLGMDDYEIPTPAARTEG